MGPGDKRARQLLAGLGGDLTPGERLARRRAETGKRVCPNCSREVVPGGGDPRGLRRCPYCQASVRFPEPALHATWAHHRSENGKFAGILSAQPDRGQLYRPQDAVWTCGHVHERRTDALACAGGELVRRKEAAPAESAPGPVSSRPYDAIALSPAGLVDRRADSRLSFERDGSSVTVQLAPADVHALRARLLDQCGDLKELRDRAQDLARHNVPAMDLAARTAHVAAAQALVDTAHAAGYRLSTDDHRATAQSAGYVRDFLADLAQAREGDHDPELPSGSRHNYAVRADLAAIQRIIDLLEEQR